MELLSFTSKWTSGFSLEQSGFPVSLDLGNLNTEMIQKRDVWPSHGPWAWEEVQGGEESGWPAHSYNMPNPWGRLAKGQGQLPSRANCPGFFLFTGDDLSWYGSDFQPPLFCRRLPEGSDSPQHSQRQWESREARPEYEGKKKENKDLHLTRSPEDVYSAFPLYCKALLHSFSQ